MVVTMISFVVEDRPAPQGSKRSYGNGRMVEQSKYVKSWREAVRQSAILRKDQIGADDGLVFGPGVPVDLMIRFYHRRPKSHYRTGQYSTELRPGIPDYVAKTPDLSKLIRSTEDALTRVIWHDDAQVVLLRAEQLYSDTGFEGAEITIKEVTA